MSTTEQEIEVKFLVHTLQGVEDRLKAQGAVLTAPRIRETNLRFDYPDGSLTRAGRVLRLRHDANAVMTYKGPARPGESVSIRQEIEFQVSDFEAALHLLEALGYVVSIMYEKFRTTYHLGDLTVVLDEMPFGAFVEIEGLNSAQIEEAAMRLGLDWRARSTASYLGLFTQLKTVRGLSAQNLTFAELSGVEAAPQDLGLAYADGD
jgi:adenylate cyclase class 2